MERRSSGVAGAPEGPPAQTWGQGDDSRAGAEAEGLRRGREPLAGGQPLDKPVTRCGQPEPELPGMRDEPAR